MNDKINADSIRVLRIYSYSTPLSYFNVSQIQERSVGTCMFTCNVLESVSVMFALETHILYMWQIQSLCEQ